jgi:hypothetical protein
MTRDEMATVLEGVLGLMTTQAERAPARGDNCMRVLRGGSAHADHALCCLCGEPTGARRRDQASEPDGSRDRAAWLDELSDTFRANATRPTTPPGTQARRRRTRRPVKPGPDECLLCGGEGSVIESRLSALGERRRRHQCRACRHRWTTWQSGKNPRQLNDTLSV